MRSRGEMVQRWDDKEKNRRKREHLSTVRIRKESAGNTAQDGYGGAQSEAQEDKPGRRREKRPQQNTSGERQLKKDDLSYGCASLHLTQRSCPTVGGGGCSKHYRLLHKINSEHWSGLRLAPASG